MPPVRAKTAADVREGEADIGRLLGEYLQGPPVINGLRHRFAVLVPNELHGMVIRVEVLQPATIGVKNPVNKIFIVAQLNDVFLVGAVLQKLARTYRRF